MSLLTLLQLNLAGGGAPALPIVLPQHAFMAATRRRDFVADGRTRDFTASVRVRDFIAGS